MVEVVGQGEQGVVRHWEKLVGVGEWEWKRVRLEGAEQEVDGGHWHVDEDLDIFWLDLIEDFNLDELDGWEMSSFI